MTPQARTAPRIPHPALTAAALVAAAGTALADGTPCDPRLPYTFPDLDQIRQAGPGVLGLGNNGQMYCFPTCAVNQMKYLANHGYPAMDPGPGPWLGTNAVYNQMTTAINNMGTLMGTDPITGTTGTGVAQGLAAWIDNAGLAGVIVMTTKGVTANDAPELGDIALAMLLDCPTNVGVGWYTESTPGVITRAGGHCISAVRLPNFCSATRQLSVRDPGNGGASPFTQQPGTTDTYTVQTRNVRIMSNGQEVYEGPMERLLNYGNGHIDGLRFFNPAFGIAACNNPVNGSCVSQYLPNVGFTNIPQTTHFDLPGDGIVDLDLLPSNLRLAAVVAGPTPSAPNQLVIADRAGVESRPVPLPFSPMRIATGEDESRLYALDNSGAALHVVDWKPGREDLLSVPLPAPGSALCFDDKNDQIVILSSAERRVIRVHANSRIIASDLPLPPSVVLGPTPKICVSPTGAELWITSGTPMATALTSGAGGLAVAASVRMNDPEPAPFVGVEIDDRGHVFTMAGDELVEFAPPAEPGGEWVQVPESRFAALRGMGIFKIARSRSNLIPEIHDSPEWSLAVLPSEFGDSVPDCDADWDGSGTVNSSDISAFLTSWLASVASPDLAADFNADGQVNSTDISAFLQAWLRNVQSGEC